MHDQDARELYEQVAIGTPVTVVYETLRLVEKAVGLYLKVLPDIYGRQTSGQDRFLALFAPCAAGWRIVRRPFFPLREAEGPYEIRFAVRENLPAEGGAAKKAPPAPVSLPPAPDRSAAY